MKYTDTQITFSEFPDEIALCINISNCPFHCSGCHSPELWEDRGKELNEESLATLIGRNPGISCVGFMGGEPGAVNDLAKFITEHWMLKIGWYTGYDTIPADINPENFDYIKLGPYKKEYGPLNISTTNQRMYKHIMIIDENTHKINESWKDITYKFWKNDK